MAAPTAVTGLQVGNASAGTVSRMPQTNQKPVAGAPFIRLSRKAQVQGFTAASNFAQLVNLPLKAAGGYLGFFLMTIAATGGTGVAAVYAADGPWSIISFLLLKDSLGQPIVQTDGIGLRYINMYSGQCSEGVTQDPKGLPSFTAPTSGNFSFKIKVPLQLDSAAYCALSSVNAAALPSLTIQLAASTSVYSTPPTGVPTAVNVTIEQGFWSVPIQDPTLAPPDVGSSAQWSQAPGSQVVPTLSAVRVTMPRVGTWIHTLIVVLRDNTGARVDLFPTSDLTLWVDGVPVLLEFAADRFDEMFRFTDGITRDVGVAAYTFRDAVQTFTSLADTHDLLLPTTPATLLEIGGTFPAIANSPATMIAYTGELYPVNPARVPYTHLSI